MSHVKEVRKLSGNRSRWTVEGPGGIAIHWETETTDYIPNQVIAWRSVPVSVLENARLVHFNENAAGITQVDIRLSYNPPSGVFGHGLAQLFGTDPRSQL